jgi:hypothetical protein
MNCKPIFSLLNSVSLTAALGFGFFAYLTDSTPLEQNPKLANIFHAPESEDFLD